MSDGFCGSAVGVDQRAVNVAAVRAENKSDERGDVFGLANTQDFFFANEDLEGGGFVEVAFTGESFQTASEAVCFDRAGVDGVDLDVVANAEIGHGFGEG